jgi:hypothetical protein
VLGRWTFFLFYFKGATLLDFSKIILPKPEPKLSVMWKKIGEALTKRFSVFFLPYIILPIGAKRL